MLTHLWLIRHAKSAWQTGVPDFDRPLNERGLRDSPHMRDWLSTQRDAAQWIWSSPAVRAKATAQFVHAAWPEAELAFDASLYHADPHTILDVASGSPRGVTRVAVVGHNPGMTAAVNRLAGKSVSSNLPTFGVACFVMTADGAAALHALMSPKQLV